MWRLESVAGMTRGEWLRSIAMVAAMGAILCQSPTSRAADARTVMDASAFVKMIGICVHMPYTDGAYANLPNVLADLKFLGVRNVRDGIPGTDGVPSLQARDALKRMALEGIKFNMIFPSGLGAGAAINYLQILEKAVPGSVAYVEGYNEINNFAVSFDGATGPEAALNGQKALYHAIKADPALKAVPVIDLTGFDMVKDPKFTHGSSLAGLADVMNIHVYAQNGDQPERWIAPGKPSIYAAMKDDLPKAITEFGYATRPESGWLVIGVDERTQAKGILNGLLDAARAGFDVIYIYELLDEKADPENAELGFHFGLFTFDNRPKAAAKTIRNLTSLLAADDGGGTRAVAGAQAVEVVVEAPGAKEPVHSLALTKANGNPVAAVWREPPFWNRAEGKPLEAPPLQVTVSFKGACRSTRTYDVLTSDQPVATQAIATVALSLGDHGQFVECVRAHPP
ncbi:MAG: hypothetical protein JOY90_15020 [Bradyrhizobium sp.]|uniref:hypothetical protein n=1 Tax=Bradyrhizobium sp. TaxID=376 RepID=UPI001DEC94CD|nr:hypothetical protein [Bradyrhizobium sp.]MBV9561740.1 hypothetical protein [Bradyrhizobium sp.]